MLVYDPPIADPPPAPARKRGRPPRPPSSDAATPKWLTPEQAAAHIGVSVASLWRGVKSGNLSAPSYVSLKCPRFHIDTLDADLGRLRARPSENTAGQRAARLRAARARARAARSSQPPSENEATA
jgi:hypothetical protein